MELSLERAYDHCWNLDLAFGVWAAEGGEAPYPDRDAYVSHELADDGYAAKIFGVEVLELTAAIAFLCPRHADMLAY